MLAAVSNDVVRATNGQGDCALSLVLRAAAAARSRAEAAPSASAEAAAALAELGVQAALAAALIDRSDILFRDPGGASCLHLAVAAGPALLELAGKLVDLGANLNVVDSRGDTPLHAAAKSLPSCECSLAVPR